MHFEQTNEWARFQLALGRRVYVLSSVRCAPFIAVNERGEEDALAVEKKIAGPFHYIEVNGWDETQADKEVNFVQSLLQAGKETGAVFVRWTPTREFPISPAQAGSRLPLDIRFKERDIFQFPNLSGILFVKPHIFVRQVPPRATLIIDLTKSEGELLNNMHEKMRYNIRLAERKGVVVRAVDVKEDFASFWRLMQDTARRDKIGIHPKGYYRTMLETMRGDGADAHLFLAAFEGAPLAAAILVTCGDTATYLHGGSSSGHRNLMAPHLLQWRMIQFAKARGMKWYDFWGIAPEQGTRNKEQGTDHSWAGITRFKMGFGGEVKEGAGTFDVVVRQSLYKLLTLAQTAKSIFKM